MCYTPGSDPTQRTNLGALLTEYVASSNWAVSDALGHITPLRKKLPGLLQLYHIPLMPSSDPNLQSLSAILGGAKTWQPQGERSWPNEGWSAPSFSTRRILTQSDHTGAWVVVQYDNAPPRAMTLSGLRCDWDGPTVALSMYDTVLKSHKATGIYIRVRRSGPMVLTGDQELICGGWPPTGVSKACLPRCTWLDLNTLLEPSYLLFGCITTLALQTIVCELAVDLLRHTVAFAWRAYGVSCKPVTI